MVRHARGLGLCLGMLFAAGASPLIAAGDARAASITYAFTTTITDGPQAGNTFAGQFSYDQASITPGAINSADGLLTQLSFAFGGIAYTAALANTGSLGFDAAGNLNVVLFGTNCFGGICSVTAGFNQIGVLAFLTPGGFSGNFLYSAIGAPLVYASNPASLSPLPVAEPLSAAILGAGLLGLGLVRRRRG